MKKILLIMIMSVAFMVACSDKNEGDSSPNTENLVETNENVNVQGEEGLNTDTPISTNAPEEQIPKESLPPQDIFNPENTMSPEDASSIEDTSSPEETGDPENEIENSGDDNVEVKYEYVVAYEIVGGENSVHYDVCKSIIDERIKIMGITDVVSWLENDKLYIGYNNKEYRDIVDMIAKKGEIQFRYNNEYLVFDNSKIKSIEKKTDYKGDEYLIFELYGGYSEEFAQFTQEHLGGNFVLRCDGKDVMTITIDMAIEDGVFYVNKVPGVQVLDMLSAYIQTGTTFELNPTTI